MLAVDLALPPSRSEANLYENVVRIGWAPRPAPIFPRVTQRDAHANADFIGQYLESMHGATFMEAHEHQCGLCVFQKLSLIHI